MCQQENRMFTFPVKFSILINLPGMDKVSILTNLPSPYPAVSDQNLWLHFDVVKGGAVKYIRDNFKMSKDILKQSTFSIINTQTGKTTVVPWHEFYSGDYDDEGKL